MGCDYFELDGLDPESDLEYVGDSVWNAVYTVQLGELVEQGVFDWSRPELDWSIAKFDDAQYERVCDYIVQRFMYREISIEPFLEWAVTLRRKLVYELMPKYKPMYERVAEGIDPFAESDEYYKNRTIQSAYPETLLSNNADYITDGKDEEFERVKEGRIAENAVKFANLYKGVDEFLLDELETMFISLYTANINATW